MPDEEIPCRSAGACSDRADRLHSHSLRDRGPTGIAGRSEASIARSTIYVGRRALELECAAKAIRLGVWALAKVARQSDLGRWSLGQGPTRVAMGARPLEKVIRADITKFEHRTQPLLSGRHFYHRVRRFALVAATLLLGSLTLGIIGYRVFDDMPWIDAIENAAMILGGMGPATPVHSTAGKLFAACYALFCGIVFLVAVAVLLAPALHRLMHTLHLESPSRNEE